MLDYSGSGTLITQAVDLSNLIERLSVLTANLAPKDVAIKKDLAPALPPIWGDPEQINRAVLNVFTNAVESLADRGGEISLTTGIRDCDREFLSSTYVDDELPEGRYVFIKVSDTGRGIDPAILDRIFDPFFTTGFKGRGLGLATVLGIMRGHKGAIQTLSEPHRGSTFTLFFPVRQSREEMMRSTASSATAREPSRPTILLVDDDPQVRDPARQILERQGYHVLVAVDGLDATEVIRRQAAKIDLVILDLVMPRLGGVEAYKLMRKVKPDLRVLLSSGLSKEHALICFEGLGLAGYIQKPYGLAELTDRVKAVLAS